MKYASLAAALLLAACATQPAAAPAPQGAAAAAAGHDCFHSDNVSGFNVVNDTTVMLHVGPSRDYTLTTNRTVHDLRSEEHIAVRTSDPSGWICTGNGLGVEIYGGPMPSMPWIVTGITRAPQAPPAPPPQNPPSRY